MLDSRTDRQAPLWASSSPSGWWGSRSKKLSRSENFGIFAGIRVVRIVDLVCGTGAERGRNLAGRGAVVAWRGRWALDTDGRLGIGEAGVERGVIGDALVDEVGGGPGLAGSEPDGIDGLLGSE